MNAITHNLTSGLHKVAPSVTHRTPTPAANRESFATVRARTRAAYLDLRVHLINGKSLRFVQTDTAAATELLARLRADRAFAQPQLSVFDGSSTTTVPTDVIERLELLTSPGAVWQPETFTVREVTDRSRLVGAEGIRCEVELFSGRTVLLDVFLAQQGSPMLPVDRSLALNRLFSGKSVIGRREGGLFLLNPANIMRVESHSAETPIAPGVLQARQVRERHVMLEAV